MPKIDAADLDLSLRIVGNSKPSFTISTDEGDGTTICKQWNYKDGIGIGLKPESNHYEEWIAQLEYIISRLRELKRKT
jgi:hypothetical protein